MPAGIDHPFIGSVAFTVTKLAGYCLAAFVMSKVYHKTPGRALWIGLARTVIGLAFGYPYFQWATAEYQDLRFMSGLVPIRIIEWLILISLFYDRRLVDRPKALGCAAVATVWSFFLDIPATLGFFAVAGFWVC